MFKQFVPIVALVVCASAVTTAVPAQEPPVKSEAAPAPAQDAMPSPKVPEHDALRSFIGSWTSTMRTEAVPGVPGMETAMEVEGRGRVELVCDGMWAKCSVEGEFNGQPFQGLWLAGYDPFDKQYVSMWVDNNEPTPSEMTGTYDKQTNRWAWHGTCPFGEMRSEIVWKDADTMVETMWLTPPGGEELQTMQVTRKRDASKPSIGSVAEATLRDVAKSSPEVAALHEDIGTWSATVSMVFDPSAPASEESARERVTPICGGKYLWTDFNGSMMGAPFEGHAIVGYDSTAGEMVSYWIDSMSATWARTSGKFDADADSVTLDGTCRGPDGGTMNMRETMTRKGPNNRHARMEFSIEGMDGKHVMEIDYVRESGAKR